MVAISTSLFKTGQSSTGTKTSNSEDGKKSVGARKIEERGEYHELTKIRKGRIDRADDRNNIFKDQNGRERRVQ